MATFSYFEIPLSAQAQTVQVTIANVIYQMTVQWRDGAACGWVLDIADSGSNPIIQGIPLVTGRDLLAQYAHLGIGGSLAVATDGDLEAVPVYDNLGITSHLYLAVAA